MEQVTLQFRSAQDLWNYRVAAHINCCYLDAANRLLTFTGRHQKIQKAQEHYQAIIRTGARSECIQRTQSC